MKITKADEGALIIALAEKIQETRVTHYSYAPVGRDWEEQVYSGLDDKFVRTLKSRLDGSLEAFFQERVFKTFFENGNKIPSKDEDGAKLTSYEGFSDPLKVARDFIGFLKTLPLQYVSYLPINRELEKYIAENHVSIDLSDQLAIVKGEQAISEVDLLNSNGGHFEYLTRWASSDKIKIEIDSSRHYFRFRQSGYVCARSEPRIVADMGDAIRAFYGASLASELFYPYTSSFRQENPGVIVARNGDDGGWKLAAAMSAEDDLKHCMQFSLSKASRGRLSTSSGLAELISLAKNMFLSADRQRLRTSAIWLLRAYLSERDMDQILASAIAVEVLLGDREASDRIGLTKLMANRCAYTLGASASDRLEIADFFTRWYKLRSEVVHSGRMRVSGEERKVVRDGLALAARLFQHEVKMAA